MNCLSQLLTVRAVGRRARPQKRAIIHRNAAHVLGLVENAGPLVERLEKLGHEVIECPLIEIERHHRVACFMAT